MGKAIVLGIGAVVAAGVAYVLYKKNQTTTAQNALAPVSSGGSMVNTSSPGLPAAQQTNSSGLAPVQQTLWKDPDGHVFELITSSEDKYGYLLKVDGGGQSKAVTVSQGPDGYITIKNKVNETWKFKNGWQRLSGLSGLRGLGDRAYLLN